ncbi:unnamed protein product [Pelagomonas calceolata]|uniref:Uncharacterized protein n=1 Tax=Pelagomonas calceolata TaxID=35677 RepID=A0A8J2X035_9STRA|nr:unnamed protein product [Pelagomonas calceolata]
MVTSGPKKIWPNKALVSISLRPFFGMRRVICAYQTCACVVFFVSFLCCFDGVSAAPPRRRRRVFPRRSQHRRREVQTTNRRRRQQPRRVGLLDPFQFLGAGVARAEDDRARRGFRGERRLVHAARVGLRGGAERARDAERVGGARRLCGVVVLLRRSAFTRRRWRTLVPTRSHSRAFIVPRRVDGVLAGTDGVLHRISTRPVRRASVPHQYASAARQHETSVSLSPRRHRDGMSASPSRRRRRV